MNKRAFPPAALAACLVFATTACAPGTDQDAAPERPMQAQGDPLPPPAPASATSTTDPATDPALDRAKAAAMAFSGQLRGKLQAAMQAGGPTAAVEVCHAEAPAIADAVMAEHGVRLGRVALPGRNRHPAQAAQDWQLLTLDLFQQRVSGGEAAADQVAVIREHLPDGIALRMMRGIATEPGCLACHGSEVAEPVRAAIAERYPDDHATGFAVGDLRGALWVEVPADAGTTGDTP
ncbi:c-type heme family protein [Pseudoxanthomonas taiwanensis]|jgi:Protein of unknown function (DUF3365).|uniref:Glutamate synthase n=1 Tax=Pseudoxanthomonas taiwanensis TaxID=176598 RepID=A0A921TGJ2_9GAMM|nr:DUF3365 domain-containing protein [Pseudoxanthomonas taiwanensis]KAF1689663.1 glutamate synthase [Pseudoxanthomonas taiwanensis]MBO2466942.1 glutamate synthase [Xanthomonadaceae bacterium]